MLKILLGFLPWIAYFILSGSSQTSHLLALSVALIMMVLFDRRELKKGFILVWGSTLFFSALLIISLLTTTPWFSAQAGLLGNIALMLITWFSLLIGKPFTIQYAREETDPLVWESPLFLHINVVLTAVWGISFTILSLIGLLRRYFQLPDDVLYQSFTYIPTLLAIIFTKQYPDYCQKKCAGRQIKRAKERLTLSPFLKGNFAPVHKELSIDALEISGEIPADMEGVYMRNGPNPEFPPFSYTYPFDGDGMIHALYFKNKMVSYRNRFIVTDQLATERRFGKALYGGVETPVILDEEKLNPNDSKMPVKLGRFIHVIQHAGHFLALHESTSAYEITKNLDTIAPWNPTMASTPPDVNAHSRCDRETGARFFISYSTDHPILSYLVLDKRGKVTQQGSLGLDKRYMIHDFVLTKHYMVIFLCPIIFDLFSADGPLIWDGSSPTKVLILQKMKLDLPNITLTTEPFFSFHFANAYEEGKHIIVDHVRYEQFPNLMKSETHPRLYRSVIHLEDQTCSHKRLDHQSVEFPRINEAFDSKPYRYLYAALKTESTSIGMQAVIKYDLNQHTSEIHDFGQHAEIGEAVFVPKDHAYDEDDGYLLTYVYDKLTTNSHCVLLNAKHIAQKPIASIALPQRVPHGLHGSWIPDKDLDKV